MAVTTLLPTFALHLLSTPTHHQRPAASATLEAFTQFHHDRYLRYARARLDDPAAAATAVAETFTDLSVVWKEILSSPSPAALAWRILRHAVERRPRASDGEPAGPAFTAEQADAMLLHGHLDMPVAEAADVMGIDDSLLRVRLASAQRLLCARSRESGAAT
ncbi:hypothetical protein [Streptomyces sp. NPDC020965]|uniref:hypothetical protein n=1 Tax=Streptomyces sp. NPDC020965 TaxID=3365105 RepID=UPI0037BB4AD7